MDNLVNTLVGQTVGLTANQMQAASSGNTAGNTNVIDKLTNQILATSDPTKWTGQGFGSAKANAADMAKIIADTGATDISQFGQIKIPIKDEDGNVSYQTTYGNKTTNQPVANTYSERQTGNAFGGTFTGKGNTGYRVEFDASGKPIFYTTGASSSDVPSWVKPALILGGAYLGLNAAGLLGSGASVAGSAFELANAGAGAFEGGSALSSLAGTGAGSAFEALNAGAGAFEGGTALNSLAAMTPAELAKFEAMNAGASAMTGGTALSGLTPAELAQLDLATGGAGGTAGATSLANAAATGADVSTLTNLTGGSGVLTGAAAGITADSVAQKLAADAATAKAAADAATAKAAADAATAKAAADAAKVTTLIDPTTGLIAKAVGDLTSTVANQQGITDARNAITAGGATANTALNKAYTDAQTLNTSGRTDLANNYANLNTNLNNTLAGQTGIYNATGTNLANNYANLNTNLNNTLAGQISAYDTANQGIKTNASTQLGLLGSTYQGQKDQAANNAATLNANYANTRGDLYDIYNKQVGFQQPYQEVGKVGSQGLIDNKDYFQHQFDVNDLNSQLAPNYAFQLAQGQMANQRAANMGGGSIGGNALQGLQKYTQDYASGAYQNAFNNYNTQRNNIYSTLRGMADIGTTSGGQLASLGNTLGGNLGSLSNTLGSNLTANAANLLSAGNAYGSNTSGVTNNLNNVLSSNLGQLQGAYNQYGSNLTSGSTNYANNVLGNANTMQGNYNNYGNNLTSGSTNYANNLTTNTGTGVNAANVYGLNSANLATGLASALASNSTATGANNATALSNLGNTALLGSMIKAT